ncbi:SET domain-containing protein SmydA-8-like [Rhopalosiphum padi]|uniref:SET domain-containing protein SmydA-8-like n=1 Tax=Rhopalosiphum padi TaxID=40932 RepID=UPI00298E71C6|nr:SET domain-containing protein SmydA-8-like [Rhopalosiphum padi]
MSSSDRTGTAGHAAAPPPYEVAESPELGRHWVAVRDIAAGEVLLEERPLVVGPKAGSPPVCLTCYAPDSGYRCSACGWPVCGPRCQAAPVHRDAECPLIGGHYDGRRSAAFCFVTPLRCMLLLHQPDGRRATEFRSLQSHLDDRLDTPLYRAYAINVAAFVLDRLGLRSAGYAHDHRSALEAAAVLDTNAFEVRRPGGRKFRAVYARASLMAHCCTPNTKHVFVGDAADGQPTIRVVATVPIARGCSVTATYTQTLWCTRDRRRHLSAAKCFECTCARCTDPEELGTHMGSAACGGQCPSGRATAAGRWLCATCGRPAADPEAVQAVRAVGVLSKTRDCAGFEQFLERVRGGTMPPLHDNHHVAVGVKYALAQLYDDRISDLTAKQLGNNTEICEQLLRLADVLEPGITRFRGLLLYYLVRGLKQLKRMKHRRNYDEMIKNYAREAVVILKTEPDLVHLVEQLQ